MKIPYLLTIVVFTLFACENRSEKRDLPEFRTAVDSRFPASMDSVFEAHGGLDNWKAIKTFTFEIEKPNGNETHSIELATRKTIIAADNFSLGFDGNVIWLNENDEGFSGDAGFYYNSMFYFSAIPFIFSDPGVFHTERKDVVIKGKNLGVIHIGFSRNVGNSPLDEYMIYYDKETYKMEWLAYTVTYSTNKKSNQWHFAKYDSWTETHGLLLPKKIIWYDAEGGKPSQPKSSLIIENIGVHENILPAAYFKAPAESEIVEYITGQ